MNNETYLPYLCREARPILIPNERRLDLQEIIQREVHNRGPVSMDRKDDARVLQDSKLTQNVPRSTGLAI